MHSGPPILCNQDMSVPWPQALHSEPKHKSYVGLARVETGICLFRRKESVLKNAHNWLSDRFRSLRIYPGL